MQSLESQWSALASEYTTDVHLVQKLWEELHRSYTASGRYYHNLTHIANLLHLTKEHQSFIREINLVRFAVFYHDIVYKTTRSDNEERSAALATERLKELHVPQEEIDMVQVMILATRTHQLHQEEDINLLVDFDLSILGADWENYAAYSQQIRKEYSLYPDLLYNNGRKKVLQHFLNRPSIYLTALFQDKLEAQARQNLQQELDSY
ncbi:hypothetical protein ACFS7Z_03670 [Pontibacter toksunensis]|uniref:Metal-dependent HD superfamily phosphohydrolase n=1 Tax=Pontibacter toksunensis TaxID=1332631 RepID=A0ABW6BTP0_9BACT